MLTVPVRQTGLATTIAEAQVADWRAVAQRLVTMRQAYAKSPHRQLLEELAPLYKPETDFLVDFLIPLLEWLRERFGVRTPMMRASTPSRRRALATTWCGAFVKERARPPTWRPPAAGAT